MVRGGQVRADSIPARGFQRKQIGKCGVRRNILSAVPGLRFGFEHPRRPRNSWNVFLSGDCNASSSSLSWSTCRAAGSSTRKTPAAQVAAPPKNGSKDCATYKWTRRWKAVRCNTVPGFASVGSGGQSRQFSGSTKTGLKQTPTWFGSWRNNSGEAVEVQRISAASRGWSKAEETFVTRRVRLCGDDFELRPAFFDQESCVPHGKHGSSPTVLALHSWFTCGSIRSRRNQRTYSPDTLAGRGPLLVDLDQALLAQQQHTSSSLERSA